MTELDVTSRADYLAAAATRRERVFELIAESISTRGYPPTVSEIADVTGMSKLITRRDLRKLRDDGRIEIDAGVTRGIRLT